MQKTARKSVIVPIKNDHCSSEHDRTHSPPVRPWAQASSVCAQRGQCSPKTAKSSLLSSTPSCDGKSK
eukprot:6478092-Amphidinium_carterae.1